MTTIEQIKNNFLGKEITNVRKELGYWWVCTYSDGHRHTFERTGKGIITFICNDKNIVKNVKGNIINGI